jgi:TetR/AcrR family transcriptional repressor of lmrAB and yxaGH operons
LAAAAKHRDTIVAAAAMLFRRQGYAATGINDIVAGSGAPKGSLYHYFPGGKAQIGAAAVRFAGGLVTATLERLAGESATPGVLIRAYGAQLAGWMAASGFRDGCPIATILLEVAPAEADITAAGAEALGAWTAIIARALVAHGTTPPRAERLAALAVAAIEGSLLQARVTGSTASILTAAEEIAETFSAETRAD